LVGIEKIFRGGAKQKTFSQETQALERLGF
jgi:hypothetical protein